MTNNSPTTNRMTQGEWRDQNYRMVWSIYDQQSYDAYSAKPHTNREKSRADFREILLDLRAPEGTPDGIHKVRHSSGWKGMPKYGVSVGVIVKDGYFLPDPTEATIFVAVCKSYGISESSIQARHHVIDHVFIESIQWDSQWGGLLVITGS